VKIWLQERFDLQNEKKERKHKVQVLVFAYGGIYGSTWKRAFLEAATGAVGVLGDFDPATL
jgi:hypothetical protein